MKFETLILNSLFAASALVCGLIFVAMLSSSPHTARLVSSNHASVVLAAASSPCVTAHNDVACPRSAS
ncbi:MAG: hypothetical protein WA777_09060 [Rhodanobacter sp.]